MKFPNLIIRIVLDLNKYICSWNINFRRKFHQLQATESFWEYMRNGQMVSVQTYNEIIKTFKIWRYPAIKGIYTSISIYDSKYTYTSRSSLSLLRLGMCSVLRMIFELFHEKRICCARMFHSLEASPPRIFCMFLKRFLTFNYIAAAIMINSFFDVQSLRWNQFIF